MASKVRTVRLQNDAAVELDQLLQRAGGFVGSLQKMADTAAAGKQRVLDSIAAGEDVFDQEYVDEMDAALTQARGEVQVLLDKVDAAIALK